MKSLSSFFLHVIHRVTVRRSIVYGLVFNALLMSNFSQAGVAMGLTRVIVTGDKNSGSVQILNKGDQPALIQMWVDNKTAEMDQSPDKINVPFVIETPVFRLNANTNQWVRIFYSGKAGHVLPDRESMFWLNVLEVPPKAEGDRGKQNKLQIAFRSRLKLFYRPAGIPASAQGVEQKLAFQLVPKGNSYVLRVTNPTPFHVTFLSLALGGENSKPKDDIALNVDAVVPPKESVDIQLKSNEKLSGINKTVFFSIIDDFGTTVEGQQAL